MTSSGTVAGPNGPCRETGPPRTGLTERYGLPQGSRAGGATEVGAAFPTKVRVGSTRPPAGSTATGRHRVTATLRRRTEEVET
jgi:hypothetical protein